MAEWVCLKCRSINNPGATACYSCATPRHLAEATAEQLAAPLSATPPAGVAQPPASLTPSLDHLGPTPALEASAAATYPADQLQGYSAPAQPRPTSLAGGLFAGLAGAVLGTAVWYAVVVLTEYQVGFVAAAIGWLVGFAVVFGAGGRASMPLVVASGLLTLAALGISEYLIIYHLLTEQLGLAFSLIQPPDVIFEVILESLQADPVTLVFWGIALFGAISVPYRSMSPQEGSPQ